MNQTTHGLPTHRPHNNDDERMSTDRNFDEKAERFARRIYDSPKGQLRLLQLWADLTDFVPVLQGPAINVWDAGGGLGQMSERIAMAGHNVLLNDISSAMIEQARQRIGDEPAQRIDFRQSSMQSIAGEGRTFDLVICHAVLEWLQHPQNAIEQLIQAVNPGGFLSLAFYNRNALQWLNVLKGNFIRAQEPDQAGHAGGLTPPNPQNPDQVLGTLEQADMDIVCSAGVRVVYDYLRPDIRQQRSIDDIITLETKLRREPAYWRLGRYVHLIARRN